MKDIDDKLIDLNEEINRRKKLKIHLEHLDEMIKIKELEKKLLAVTLAKEEYDVLALEKLTIHSLFASILGTKEKQLEKERQEYLHALMMYRGVEETFIELIEERNILIKSLNGLHVVQREFDRLIINKEKLLQAEKSYPEDLVTLNDQVASFNLQIKELDQAIKKGVSAQKFLRKIVFDLKRIEKWGFENRHRNSSSVLQKSKVIQSDIYKANNVLQKYEDQLHDISVHFSINFEKEIKKFEAFLDRFVDSLITDWIVNNKIENSIHFVYSMVDNITKLNGSLEFQQIKVQNYLNEDNELKAQIILEFINKNKS